MNRDDLIEELKKCPPGKVVIKATMRNAGEFGSCETYTLDLKITSVRTVPHGIIEAE